ncbi:MAG: VCBS domain-containing protein, partial [Planctomycetia bacterium]|nr:VCBS domain-containing protein [Planctomycetia bacterium]
MQQDVKVTITGTNDAPDLSLSNTNMVVSEDGVGQGTHTVLDDDADGALAGGKTVNHKFSIEHRPGENDDASIDSSVPSADFGDDAVFETKYGTLTVKADGTYTFEPSVAAQHLGAGDDVTLHFDITVTDRHDAHDTESITVTLKGANDDPTGDVQRGSLVLKESGVGDKTETGINDGWAEGPNQARIDGISEADGQFKVHEVDTNDTLTLTRDPGTGELYVKDAYGTLFVTETTVNNPDGSHDTTYSYRYELDNDAVNGLKQYDETDGATHVEGEDHYSGKYTLSVSDGRPGSTPAEHEVDILIKGTNDQPKVEYSKVHAKEEGVSMGKDGDGNTATTDDGKDNGYVFPDHHRVEVSGHVNVSDPDQDGGFGLSVKLGDEFAGKDVTHYQGEGSSATPFVDASGNAFTSNITVDPAGSSETDNVQVIKTNYGTLTFHKQDWTETLGDGSTVYHKAGDYTFALDGDAAQSLAKGEKLDFHFTVTATDEHGSQGHHMI